MEGREASQEKEKGFTREFLSRVPKSRASKKERDLEGGLGEERWLAGPAK